ncbi:MAG: hypothetical protein EOT04_00785 [Candidatus Chaera renei]|uniref:Ribosomal RNA large subunit methyltransferase K/L-like methyltransferase domain-containing protein n=1 Tax=Candidatus Chaera renei TaxID=2506947 RepID=A0A4Q0AJM0_9BACT|nr:MAG: hypothetical protein EOT04_00785 [Candidatus Chaera renei]
MSSLCVLGRQPALGLAELESVFGAKNLSRVATEVARLSVPAQKIAGRPLGGAIKTATILADMPLGNIEAVLEALPTVLADELAAMPEGKLRLGISLYGFRPPLGRLRQYGLSLKKRLSQQTSRNIRIVPNKELALNSAQITYNRLTDKLGMELLLVRSGESTIIGRTIKVQDINDYASRDQARPARDARVGMLPPKLAQIMINLAIENGTSEPAPTAPLLDPFCGSGVILQEAALMGLDVYGTDIDPRMVEYCRRNLDWLRRQRNVAFACRLEVADARSFAWHKPVLALASETYLGPPLFGQPAAAKLQQIVKQTDRLLKDFLINLAQQLEPQQRICLAVPSWRQQNGFLRLPLIDELGDLGYNLESFVHATLNELIYHRPNQIVARQLLVLTRK